MGQPPVMQAGRRRKRLSQMAETSTSDPASPTRSARLVEHLRQGVLDGKFPLGRRLNEVHLSRELQVSRTPIRAALQMLAGEGLLRHTPNKGFTVREFPLSEIVDAYELRALAEGLAAKLAAERGLTDDMCQVLERALADGDRALARRSNTEMQRAAYARINELIHSTIHEAARSDLVKEVVRLCQRVPQAAAHNVVAFDLTDVRNRHRAHHEIYDAILSREPHKAEALMRQHVLAVKISMVRSIAKRTRRKP